MLRIVLLVVTAVFIGFIGVVTVLDMIHNGVTWLDVLALAGDAAVRDRDHRLVVGDGPALTAWRCGARRQTGRTMKTASRVGSIRIGAGSSSATNPSLV